MANYITSILLPGLRGFQFWSKSSLVYSKLYGFLRHELFKSAASGPNFGLKYGRTRHYYSNHKFILQDNAASRLVSG